MEMEVNHLLSRMLRITDDIGATNRRPVGGKVGCLKLKSLLPHRALNILFWKQKYLKTCGNQCSRASSDSSLRLTSDTPKCIIGGQSEVNRRSFRPVFTGLHANQIGETPLSSARECGVDISFSSQETFFNFDWRAYAKHD